MHVQADHGVARVGVSGSHKARPSCSPCPRCRAPARRRAPRPPARSRRSADPGRGGRRRPRPPTPTSPTPCAPTRPPGRTRACSSPSTRPAGRGRAGRTWETPPRDRVDLQLRRAPAGPRRVASAGSRCSPASAPSTRCGPRRASPPTLKWPNDLLVPADTEVEGWGAARKVGGILAEVVALPAGQPPAVVIGIGINVLQGADELPVASATSLALAGAQHVDREGMLVALVAAQLEVAQRWRDSGGDAVGSGLADEVAAVCSTLGTPGARGAAGRRVGERRRGAARRRRRPRGRRRRRRVPPRSRG